MSRFDTPLIVEKQPWDGSADERGTWILQKPLAYKSDIAGYIIVPEGFITDFASVPRIPVAFLLTGNSAHEAAVIHDWLYTTHEVSRETADRVFHEACLACGVASWRAQLMYWGVRFGGGHSYDAPGPKQDDTVDAIVNVLYKGA